jgi:hypothetical protein
MNTMKMVTFAISGIDWTMVVICLLRLGLAFIVLNGRITRSVLNALRLTLIARISIKLEYSYDFHVNLT